MMGQVVRVGTQLLRALGVRVLDTQTELAAMVARKPTEDTARRCHGERRPCRYADARSGSFKPR